MSMSGPCGQRWRRYSLLWSDFPYLPTQVPSCPNRTALESEAICQYPNSSLVAMCARRVSVPISPVSKLSLLPLLKCLVALSDSPGIRKEQANEYPDDAKNGNDYSNEKPCKYNKCN